MLSSVSYFGLILKGNLWSLTLKFALHAVRLRTPNIASIWVTPRTSPTYGSPTTIDNY